jgi:hypothetical protein
METIPNMRKTSVLDRTQPNPFYGKVLKRTINASVGVYGNVKGSAYELAVMNGLLKEGKDPFMFELQPRKWGTRIPGTGFIEHQGKLYIELIFIKPGEVTYLYEGRVIMKEEIQGLPQEYQPEQAGLEKKVIIRTPLVESITEVRADGQVWR